jgi:hypothetical protein
MRASSLAVWLAAGIYVSAACVSAQAPTPPPEKVAAMKKLDSWAGRWKGTGWAMVQSGERREFNITETIQSKIAGTVLLIEGVGVSKTGDKDALVHNALGMVSYDAKNKRYRMQTHDLRGQAIDTELKLVEGGAEWGFKVEDRPVTVRFTIKLDEKKWQESGEVTLDEGKTWLKFMEMNLEREKAVARR